MSEDIDLKALEKRAYRSTFDDGLWDLFIGLIVLSIGLGPLIGYLLSLYELWTAIIPSLICNILAFLIFYFGKKYITIPRIGYVKFGLKRKSKQLKLKFFLIIVFIVNVILFVLPLLGIIDYAEIAPLFITLLLGFGVFTFPFCVMAYFLDYTRLYYYAFSVGIGYFLIEFLTPIVGYLLGMAIIFNTIGASIVLIGLYYFIYFLKKYPLSKQEEFDGEEENRIR
jgi:MFS family permease